jgi:hypothetical protein
VLQGIKIPSFSSETFLRYLIFLSWDFGKQIDVNTALYENIAQNWNAITAASRISESKT